MRPPWGREGAVRAGRTDQSASDGRPLERKGPRSPSVGGAPPGARAALSLPPVESPKSRTFDARTGDAPMMLRDATPDDIDAIVAMLADDPLGRDREAPGDPAYRAAFDAIAAQQGNALIVAERDGVVIGCLQLTFLPGLSRKGQIRAQIEGVRVARVARNGGVGAALVEEALRRSRAAGCGMVQLATDRSRADAQRFYARLGFEASHVGMKMML